MINPYPNSSRPRQATLKDIADITGLTVATVSRILTGKKGFADPTIKRVRIVAETLGYRPNKLVSGMQTGRTGMIGAIVPVHAEWGANLLTGLSHELVSKAYVPIVLDCPSEVLSEKEMIYHLLDRRVEGVALFPSDDTISDAYFSEVRSRNIPIIAMVRRLVNVHCPFVGCDDRKSGALAARHLLEFGHRNLGHLAGPPGMSTGADRADGFISEVLRRRDATVSQVIFPRFLPDTKLIEDFLDEHPDLTGIFCANESLALALYRIAKSRNISIPNDLSVVSHGNFKLAEYFHPALTSTVENSYEIGRLAAKTIISMIEGDIGTNPPNQVVDTELVVRGSTSAPAR
jgi:LacI family transcriptional regulator